MNKGGLAVCAESALLRMLGSYTARTRLSPTDYQYTWHYAARQSRWRIASKA